MHVLAGIFLATFVAEDLTAIGTGLLTFFRHRNWL